MVSLFANTIPDPVDISLEYLDLCRKYPDTATLQIIQAHIRHFVEFQWSVIAPSVPILLSPTDSGRRPWYAKFRNALTACKSLDEIELLLKRKVERWRGQTPRTASGNEYGTDPEDIVDTFQSLGLTD